MFDKSLPISIPNDLHNTLLESAQHSPLRSQSNYKRHYVQFGKEFMPFLNGWFNKQEKFKMKTAFSKFKHRYAIPLIQPMLFTVKTISLNQYFGNLGPASINP